MTYAVTFQNIKHKQQQQHQQKQANKQKPAILYITNEGVFKLVVQCIIDAHFNQICVIHFQHGNKVKLYDTTCATPYILNSYLKYICTTRPLADTQRPLYHTLFSGY